MQSLLKSFVNAFRGLWHMLRNERNAQIHLLAALVVFVAGYYFGLNKSEWLWIFLAVTLVFVSEGINTAIELLADKVSPEHDQKIGRSKDVAAGAVVLAAGFAVLTAILIFGPYIRDLFF